MRKMTLMKWVYVTAYSVAAFVLLMDMFVWRP